MLMFYVLPAGTPSTNLAVYYFAFNIIYNMFFSISSIPHQAMSPDISANYDDRLSLSTSRSIFSFVGMLGLVIWAFFVVGYIVPAIQSILLAGVPSIAPVSAPVEAQTNTTSPIAAVAPVDPAPVTNDTAPIGAPLFDNGAAQVKQFTHQLIAAFPSGSILIFGVFCMIATRKYMSSGDLEEEVPDVDESGRPTHLRFCRILGHLICMRSFVIVCLMYTFVGTAIAVTQSVLPLFILYSIGLPNGLQRFTEVTIAITAAMILTIIFVSRVGHRFEKRTLFNFGAILSVLVYAGYYFVPGIDNTDPLVLRYGIYVFGVFSGIGQALAYTLPNAMMSDVTDEALLIMHEKHEGMMFSLMETLQSFLQASTMWVIGLILDRYGYTQTGAQQPYDVRQIIRYMFCFVPLASFGVVWLLSFLYPITREKHKDILKRIRHLEKESGETPRLRSAPSARVMASKNILTATMARPNFEDKEEEHLAGVIVDNGAAPQPAEMEHLPQVQESSEEAPATPRKDNAAIILEEPNGESAETTNESQEQTSGSSSSSSEEDSSGSDE
eukprot:TRINITY_DN1975_c0_g2_i1.p1 TRINITY_DN1975_c0_g2~~TRINITY_DN1975_c0_g2_i1.p1  ORF type:complete len:554 (+),score=103.27 TRINITY_DN1975_c0_g2_i1:557-2218(+)